MHAQAILEAAELKQDGRIRKVVVTGCLAQRYSQDLAGIAHDNPALVHRLSLGAPA